MKREDRDLFDIPQEVMDEVSDAARILRGFVSKVDSTSLDVENEKPLFQSQQELDAVPMMPPEELSEEERKERHPKVVDDLIEQASYVSSRLKDDIKEPEQSRYEQEEETAEEFYGDLPGEGDSGDLFYETGNEPLEQEAAAILQADPAIEEASSETTTDPNLQAVPTPEDLLEVPSVPPPPDLVSALERSSDFLSVGSLSIHEPEDLSRTIPDLEPLDPNYQSAEQGAHVSQGEVVPAPPQEMSESLEALALDLDSAIDALVPPFGEEEKAPQDEDFEEALIGDRGRLDSQDGDLSSIPQDFLVTTPLGDVVPEEVLSQVADTPREGRISFHTKPPMPPEVPRPPEVSSFSTAAPETPEPDTQEADLGVSLVDDFVSGALASSLLMDEVLVSPSSEKLPAAPPAVKEEPPSVVSVGVGEGLKAKPFRQQKKHTLDMSPLSFPPEEPKEEPKPAPAKERSVVLAPPVELATAPVAESPAAPAAEPKRSFFLAPPVDEKEEKRASLPEAPVVKESGRKRDVSDSRATRSLRPISIPPEEPLPVEEPPEPFTDGQPVEVSSFVPQEDLPPSGMGPSAESAAREQRRQSPLLATGDLIELKVKKEETREQEPVVEPRRLKTAGYAPVMTPEVKAVEPDLRDSTKTPALGTPIVKVDETETPDFTDMEVSMAEIEEQEPIPVPVEVKEVVSAPQLAESDDDDELRLDFDDEAAVFFDTPAQERPRKAKTNREFRDLLREHEHDKKRSRRMWMFLPLMLVLAAGTFLLANYLAGPRPKGKTPTKAPAKKVTQKQPTRVEPRPVARASTVGAPDAGAVTDAGAATDADSAADADAAVEPPDAEVEPRRDPVVAPRPVVRPRPIVRRRRPRPVVRRRRPRPRPVVRRRRRRPRPVVRRRRPRPRPVVRRVKRNPKLAKKLFLRGTRQFFGGKLSSARRTLNKATKADPRHAGSYRVLTLVYIRMKKKAQAKRAWRKFKALSPKSPFVPMLKKQIDTL